MHVGQEHVGQVRCGHAGHIGLLGMYAVDMLGMCCGHVLGMYSSGMSLWALTQAMKAQEDATTAHEDA